MVIILAFDSFKGSLTASRAVEVAKEGILSALPDADILCMPLADGGEGTVPALSRHFNAIRQVCTVHDPLFRPIKAEYAISQDGNTAIMEMAEAAGLTLLAEKERNPLKTTTYGVGEMILDAKARGCRHITIGIGGSATNDGGIGMLAALGVQFLDKQGMELRPTGASLSMIESIDWTGLVDLEGITIDVICDVENPLFGQNGAAFTYAWQKGADEDAVLALDNGLRNFAAIASLHSTISHTLPGSGAAGGLGFGLSLLGANLRKGADVILDATGFDRYLGMADLVITGEGRIDSQTLNGKLPYCILQRAKSYGIPVIALAGQIEDREILLHAGFQTIETINPPEMDIVEAIRPETAAHNLSATAKQVTINYMRK